MDPGLLALYPVGCGPESAGAETEGEEWDALPGLDWQIRGSEGVTSASIVPSNSWLISHGDCAFFWFCPKTVGKKES